MSGSSSLLDTNILLYLLGGKIDKGELPGGRLAISFVTELEVLSYPDIGEDDEKKLRRFLDEILIVDINEIIKEFTIELRRRYKLKLPDAIVAATAMYLEADLVTNDREFAKVKTIKSVGIPLKKN